MIWSYLIARAKEPSSYAGLGIALAALGLHLSAAQLGAVVTLCTALAGALAVLLPEKHVGPTLKTLLALLVVSVALSACSASQQAAVSADVRMVQPIASEVACADQAAANVTGAILTATGDSAGAAAASTASTITGYLCNGLKAGAPVTLPAAVAPAAQALAKAS